MTKPDEIERFLNLSRNNASQELRISNEILSIVDWLAEKSVDGQVEQKDIMCAADSLVTLALQLTEESKKISVSVSKLVGAM